MRCYQRSVAKSHIPVDLVSDGHLADRSYGLLLQGVQVMHSIMDIKERMQFWRSLKQLGLISWDEYKAIFKWMMEEKRNAKQATI